MDDDITRKRLKKKVLERWENEGGRILANPSGANEDSPISDREGELKRKSRSHRSSTVGTSKSPTKESEPTDK